MMLKTSKSPTKTKTFRLAAPKRRHRTFDCIIQRHEKPTFVVTQCFTASECCPDFMTQKSFMTFESLVTNIGGHCLRLKPSVEILLGSFPHLSAEIDA
ncbi:hypothetical protein TNCV_3565791 [Trichonephila clavipes]|nr:hypothetical protein TNCV_3565791 [Trichonephila clavipes]